MKKVEAPWISDPGWIICQNPQSVYYRSHGGRPGQGIEYFALPSDQRLEMPWAEVKKHGWGHLLKFFDKLAESPTAHSGYIAYEAGYAFESHWHHLPIPTEGYAARFSEILCWHEQNYSNASAHYCMLDGASPEALHKLRRAIEPHAGHLYGPADSQMHSQPFQAEDFADSPPQSYYQAVQHILEDITSGRYYELNYTQGFTLTLPRNGAGIFLKAMKRLNPPQAFYAAYPDEEILSASPELFLRRNNNVIETRPIKGSIRYSDSSDKPLTFPLDQKLAAEHVMVVDLARNDLGRICETGSIQVEGLFSPTRFGHIAHLETGISGRCSASISPILRACFPAASITGAPKVEVVRAIAQHEHQARRLYTGTCGWLFPNGDFDLNVAIRTIFGQMTPTGWKYTVGAGGAIVSDSSPIAEYAELTMKVTPILNLLVNSYDGSVLDFR